MSVAAPLGAGEVSSIFFVIRLQGQVGVLNIHREEGLARVENRIKDEQDLAMNVHNVVSIIISLLVFMVQEIPQPPHHRIVPEVV